MMTIRIVVSGTFKTVGLSDDDLMFLALEPQALGEQIQDMIKKATEGDSDDR